MTKLLIDAFSGNFGLNPVHESEHRYLFYAQQFANPELIESWNYNDQMYLLDSFVLEYQETDTNERFVSSCCQDNRFVFVLQISSPHGNMKLNGHAASIAPDKSGARSKLPMCFSFVPIGSYIPVVGDVCFIVSAVRAGDLYSYFCYF